jgi:hypothetical protein
MEGSGSGSVQINYGLGADPGGPKTYGSFGSGSRTLEESNTMRRKNGEGKNVIFQYIPFALYTSCGFITVQ